MPGEASAVKPRSAVANLRRSARWIGAVLIAAAVPLASLSQPYAVVRERSFDLLLHRSAPMSAKGAIVVDIDRASLAENGPWPWSREQFAELVQGVARLSPSVIGLDVLLAGPDTRSAAALSRALRRATGDASVARDPQLLSDGDQRLAVALSERPAVLGMVLVPSVEDAAGVTSRTSILVSGQPRVAGIWSAPAATGPIEALLTPAQGLGVLSLAADADGRLRRLPLLVRIGNDLAPGFAVEIARTAADASALILLGDDARLQIGDQKVPVGNDMTMRLRPASIGVARSRTISAAAVLSGRVNRADLEGRPVLVGSSAAEAGGLRLTGAAQLTPSVQIHADAVDQIMSGDVPRRPAQAHLAEFVAALVAALVTAWLGFSRAPLRGAVATALLAAAWGAAAVASAIGPALLFDPLIVPLSATLAFAGAAIANGAITWAREAALRRRFAQHLAPEVVDRIVASPEMLRLEGQQRQVTVLFTDIEGFTALVERSEPKGLLALLDSYVDCVSEAIVAHGGMIDKVVGDAVHALFNAPLDLDAHETKALACAKAIVAATEALRATSEGARLGLGRTRIGIETGQLIVGDVGTRHKLDYTAHGDAINTAARLEQANKQFATSICIGPGTAVALGDAIRPVGKLLPRGRSKEITAYEPWPPDYDDRDKALYLRLSEANAKGGDTARLWSELAARHPQDSVIATKRAAFVTRA